MEHKHNITVAGCSWACGEWNSQGSNCHGGVAQYLAQRGHDVRKVALPGSSNARQTQELVKLTPREAGTVIWFLTDPARDWALAEQAIPDTILDFQRGRDALLRHNLDACQQHSIFMVGGMAHVPDWVGARYPNVRVICPSLLHWLIPTQDPYPNGVFLTYQPLRFNRPSPQLVKLLEEEQQWHDRFVLQAQQQPLSAENWYFRDDFVHPNREAHRRLCDQLIIPLLTNSSDLL